MFAFADEQFFTRFGVIRSEFGAADSGLVSNFAPAWAPLPAPAPSWSPELAASAPFLSRFFGVAAFAEVAPVEISALAALRAPEVAPAFELPALPPLAPLPNFEPLDDISAMSSAAPNASFDDAPYSQTMSDARTPPDGNELTSADDLFTPSHFTGLVRDADAPVTSSAPPLDDTPVSAFGGSDIPLNFYGGANHTVESMVELNPFNGMPVLQISDSVGDGRGTIMVADAAAGQIFLGDDPLLADASVPVDWSGLVGAPSAPGLEPVMAPQLILQSGDFDGGTIDLSIGFAGAPFDADAHRSTTTHLA